MKKDRTLLQKLRPLAVLPLILAMCLFLWHSLVPRLPVAHVEGENGVWDLRDIPFSETNVSLRGEAEYIPNALLTPAEFSAHEDEARPGASPLAEPTGTSRLRILLPDDGWYTFTRISIDFSQRVYVGGELLSQVGVPGESRDKDTPNTARVTFTVKAENGVVELVQQSSNFVHREGGYHQDWMIGTQQLALGVAAGDFTTSMEMGTYLALFLVHLLLFFTMRSYRPNLYFALFCLAWFLRMGVTGPKLFSTLLPWLDWYAKFRLEYITLPIAVVLTIALIRSLFPGILHKAVNLVFAALSGAFVLLSLFGDTLLMSRAMLVYQGLCLALILYISVLFVLRLRRLSLEQGIFIAGMALFAYAAVRDVLFYNNLRLLPPASYVELTQVAMLAFALFEAAAVFIASVKEMEAAKEREQSLAMENATLDRVNRLKTELMATVSHETRTPLAVLSGYAELIAMDLRKKGVDAHTASDLDQIADEIQRIAAIMEEMQNFSKEKDRTADRGAVGLDEILRQSARLYEPILARGQVGLRLLLPEEPILVYGSASELTQVMFNLLQNAKQHTQNGTVTIKAIAGERITVQVSDTGEGIPAELLPRVLERGVSGNGNGNGLGLAICDEIIAAHDGTLTIENNPSGGTTVTLTLPAYQEGGMPHARQHSFIG